VITLSAGNAAQAYAWAGAQFGVKVTVTMPAGAVRSKVDACRVYGAEVILHGANIAETADHLAKVRDERGLVYVHPFEDADLIAGHGSAGLEIVEDLPGVDVVVVGIGGGGLISGIAAAVKALRPAARVIGVEPEGADSMFRALAAGEVIGLVPSTIADGLAAPFAGDRTLAMVQRHVDQVVRVPDTVILAGVRFLAERTKQVVEPAGAAALGALLFGRVPLRDGERVCAVLSGGNVEISRLGS